MEDPTVVASVTVRVANTDLGRNYDVILGSTLDLRTEKWLAENTCVDWLREVLLDTKKPELELHAAQLDDCTIGMEVLRHPLSVRSANGILLTREGGDVAASDATVFVTKKWSALNFLRQVGTDSTTTMRYTLTPPEPAARTGRQPISEAPEGPTVHESLMLNHARLKTHLPSKVAHKRMYGNHSMFNNLVDLFAAHGVGFSKDVVEGTPRDMLTKLTAWFFNCCAETAVQLRDVKNAKRPFPDPMFDPFFRFISFDQLGSHQKVVTNYDKANTSFIAAGGIMNHIMKMHTASEPFLSKWLVFFASFRHYYLRISRQRAHSHMVWKVPARESERDSAATAQLHADCVDGQSNTMRMNRAAASLFRNHMTDANLCDGVAAAYAIYQFLACTTGTALMPMDRSFVGRKAWLAAQLVIESGDQDLAYDMRAYNGRPRDGAFEKFWDKLADMLEKYKQPHDRRHVLFGALDDKAKVSVGEPHCGICFGGRNRKSLMPTDVTITAMDHDFHVVSLTPNVSLLVEVPSDTDADPSFYRGVPHVCLKDAITQASSAARHMVELHDMLTKRGSKTHVLLFKTDGGPDHNCNHVHLLQNIPLMREEIPDPAEEKLMSRCNSMAAVRLAIKKAVELEAFERQQRQQQPLASEEALVEQLPGQQPPTTEEAPAKPQPEPQPPAVVEALAEAQPEQQPPATEEARAEAQPEQQPPAAQEAPAEQQPLGDEEAFDNEAEEEALSSDSDYCAVSDEEEALSSDSDYCAVSDEDEAGRDILVEDSDTEMEVAAGLGSTTMSREDVVDLVEDDQDGEDGKEVPVSSGFKSQYIASIKHVREMLEARFAHATWAGNHFQVEEPAPDEKVELILQTLKKLDPSLGTVSVTRKPLEKFHVMEKVLKNHAISTPYMVQFLKQPHNKANMATGVSRKRPRAET
eukprot:jgi/Tetstr1/462162/TSEL_007227.t1